MKLLSTVLLLLAAASLVMIGISAWKCMKATRGDGTDPFTKGTEENRYFRRWAMILMISLWVLILGCIGYLITTLFI